MEKVRTIVEKELDAELEYKLAEVALIEERLSEVETLLEKLRACTEGERGRGRRKQLPEAAMAHVSRGRTLYSLVNDKFVQYGLSSPVERRRGIVWGLRDERRGLESGKRGQRESRQQQEPRC